MAVFVAIDDRYVVSFPDAYGVQIFVCSVFGC